MVGATELGANDFVGAGLDRDEPHRNDGTGDGILGDAHVRNAEIVNDVLRRDIDNAGLVDGKMHFVDGGEVVGGIRVVAVEAELIRRADELDGGMTEFAVRSGVMEVPEDRSEEHTSEL